jgi:hypothetical protein
MVLMRLLCERLEADSHFVDRIAFSDGAVHVLHVLYLLHHDIMRFRKEHGLFCCCKCTF